MDMDWIDHFSRAGLLTFAQLEETSQSILAGDDHREYKLAALLRTASSTDAPLKQAAEDALHRTLEGLLPHRPNGASVEAAIEVVKDLLFCLWQKIPVRAALSFVEKHVGDLNDELCECACRFIVGVCMQDDDWPRIVLLLSNEDERVRKYAAHSIGIHETAMDRKDVTPVVPALSALAAGKKRAADAVAARNTLNGLIRVGSVTRLDAWVANLALELAGLDRTLADEAADLLSICSQQKRSIPAEASHILARRAEDKRHADQRLLEKVKASPNPGLAMLDELFREERSWQIDSRSMTDVDEIFRDSAGNFFLINFSPRENINYSEKKLTPEEALEIMRAKYPNKFVF